MLQKEINIKKTILSRWIFSYNDLESMNITQICILEYGLVHEKNKLLFHSYFQEFEFETPDIFQS